MANNRRFGSKQTHLGEDTKGHDFKAFGDTTGKYAEWDASADQFNIVGTLALTGAPTIVGATSITGALTQVGAVGVTGAVTISDTLKTGTGLKQKSASGSLTAGVENAIAFAFQNPEAVPIIVTRVIIYLSAAAGAAATMDVGIVNAATDTADTLIDGLNINTTGVFDNISDVSTNGKSRGLMSATAGTTDHITGKILGAAASSLAGKYHIEYLLTA